ncbi:unnamed protein product [Pleuronectes platessa]|uniref:Uncharacterized protein n=1 Tax=Pleuronectes platessa TaxID=8262 RepID=A0A9N7W384_PLEPL|nr:unnamed protein product [Pleuronectes platessa]
MTMTVTAAQWPSGPWAPSGSSRLPAQNQRGAGQAGLSGSTVPERRARLQLGQRLSIHRKFPFWSARLQRGGVLLLVLQSHRGSPQHRQHGGEDEDVESRTLTHTPPVHCNSSTASHTLLSAS